MAAIHLDGITIDLTDIKDYTTIHSDDVVITERAGDDCCIEFQVGDEAIKMHVHFNIVIALMDATAKHAGFKTVPIVDGTNPDGWDEYFDADGNYHKADK